MIVEINGSKYKYVSDLDYPFSCEFCALLDFCKEKVDADSKCKFPCDDEDSEWGHYELVENNQ